MVCNVDCNNRKCISMAEKKKLVYMHLLYGIIVVFYGLPEPQEKVILPARIWIHSQRGDERAYALHPQE